MSSQKLVLMSYEDAKKIVKGKFTCRREFWDWIKKNKGHLIPSDTHYRTTGEWISWGDFLGTGYVSTQNRSNGYYWDFQKARKFVQSLKLKGQRHWEKWNRENNRPDGCPMAFSKVYEKEWKGWADFLGNGNDRLRSQKLTYKQASKVVKKWNIENSSEYFKYVRTHKIPDNIPKDPYCLYRNYGWVDWNNFLGSRYLSTSAKSKLFDSFEEARKYVRKLGLKGYRDYIKLGRKKELPLHLPATPARVYKSEWKGWADYLGIKIYEKGNRMSFDKAVEYLRSLEIKTIAEFNKMHREGKIDLRIPISLHASYLKEKDFKSVTDMLGIRRDFNYWDYQKAKELVQKLGIKTQLEFYQARKDGRLPPMNIPSVPERVYGDNRR